MVPCAWLLIPQLCLCTPVLQAAGLGGGAGPRGCMPGGSQLPTWEERGEIWGAVAGDIGEGGPRGGGGGGGRRRWPTVSCLYERTVQTTCREKDRQTDGERESKEMGQSLLRVAMAGPGHRGTGMGEDGREAALTALTAGRQNSRTAGQKDGGTGSSTKAGWAKGPRHSLGAICLLRHSATLQQEPTTQPTAKHTVLPQGTAP